MKFTSDEAFEKLKGLLTNDGKKTLRMSEKSIKSQLETLIPLIANDDMELSDFIKKVGSTFSVINSNVENDTSNFIKDWEAKHPTEPKAKQEPEPKKKDDGNEVQKQLDALLQQVSELKKENDNVKKEKAISQKKKDLDAAMEKKGISDEEWRKEFISQIAIGEDFDIDGKVDSYVKLYNKSMANNKGNHTPNRPSRGEHNDKERWDYINKEYEKREEKEKTII